MKKTYFLERVNSLSLSLSLFSSVMLTQAQTIPGVVPRSADEQTEPIGQRFQGVHHTGTDVIREGDPNTPLLQAMVWDDQVREVRVSDLTGRVVADLSEAPRAAKGPDVQVLWHTDAVPTGSYLIRVTTNQRSDNIFINRK